MWGWSHGGCVDEFVGGYIVSIRYIVPGIAADPCTSANWSKNYKAL